MAPASIVADKVTQELEMPFTRWCEEGKTILEMAGYVAAQYATEANKRTAPDEDAIDKSVDALTEEWMTLVDAAMAQLPTELASNEKVRLLVFRLNMQAQGLMSFGIARGYELGTGIRLTRLIDGEE